MPTRILREGIITSVPVNNVSRLAELFYRRLMSLVDDFGRFYASPKILLAYLYPLIIEDVSQEEIKKYIEECQKELIIVYGGGKYLEIVNFRQQKRAIKSKFPEVFDVHMLSIDLAEKNMNAMHSHIQSQTDTHTHTSSPSLLSLNGKIVRLHGIPSNNEEVIAYGKTLDPKVCEETCRQFFSYYESRRVETKNGEIYWITGGNNGGSPITVWKEKLPHFKGNLFSNDKKSTAPNYEGGF